MILLPAVPEVRWLGTLMNAAHGFTLLACDFIRPGGGVARLRWPSILAARGEPCAAALARVAAADKYARGGYLRSAGPIIPPDIAREKAAHIRAAYAEDAWLQTVASWLEVVS